MPGGILNGGACSDAVFKATYWFATTPRWLFLALLVTSGLVVFVTKNKNEQLRGVLTFFGGIVGLFGCVMFVGGEIGFWVTSFAVLISVGIGMTQREVPRWFDITRAVLVVLAIVVGVIRASPSQRSTRELVDIALYVKKFPPQQSWLYDELLARSDTRALIEYELLKERPSAVELHRELGFDAASRREACSKLSVEQRAKACPGE